MCVCVCVCAAFKQNIISTEPSTLTLWREVLSTSWKGAGSMWRFLKLIVLESRSSRRLSSACKIKETQEHVNYKDQSNPWATSKEFKYHLFSHCLGIIWRIMLFRENVKRLIILHVCIFTSHPTCVELSNSSWAPNILAREWGTGGGGFEEEGQGVMGRQHYNEYSWVYETRACTLTTANPSWQTTQSWRRCHALLICHLRKDGWWREGTRWKWNRHTSIQIWYKNKG